MLVRLGDRQVWEMGAQIMRATERVLSVARVAPGPDVWVRE